MGQKHRHGKNAGTYKIDRGTESQTKGPNTKKSHYKKHIYTPGLRKDSSNTRSRGSTHTTQATTNHNSIPRTEEKGSTTNGLT